MIQILADHIDQLDLALDQLAMGDRNFDRFAFMLIDNVVELTLHTYAVDCSEEGPPWASAPVPKREQDAISAALGRYFAAKVRLAKSKGLLLDDVAESINYLHEFRNAVYHAGVRHEGILHSLALFYFEIACSVLAAYKPRHWSWVGGTPIPHRALKYVGELTFMSNESAFSGAWSRLRDVARAMGDTLIVDLRDDMADTIDSVDQGLELLACDSPDPTIRDNAVVHCQAWRLSSSEKCKAFAGTHGFPETPPDAYFGWLVDNYPWPHRRDPIPGWRERLVSLEKESDRHKALKKY